MKESKADVILPPLPKHIIQTLVNKRKLTVQQIGGSCRMCRTRKLTTIVTAEKNKEQED